MWVGKLFKEKARRKLSATALETLAIIAYKQPLTKSEVEFIRGVNADYIMKALLEKIWSPSWAVHLHRDVRCCTAPRWSS